jgi:RND family efflux transporter MFP subunit
MHPHNPEARKRARKKVLLLFAVVAVIACIGIGLRIHAAWALRHRTQDDAVPVVAVVKAASGPASEEIVLPGSVQAWHEAPIYARTSGYLKDWKTDIGAPVKAGQLLAEIDTPEIDAQLRQAEADLKTAEANSALAQSTAARWKALLKTDSVSRQEADEKAGDAAAKAAALAAAKANRDRLRDLESFKRVTAPFAGTITARNTDTGALINAGSASAGRELFHIADTGRLRVYVQVPQSYAGAIKPGLKAELHFAEHPGKAFSASLLSTSDAIDPASRTLLVQFAADNQKGELLAGGFTQVHLKLPAASGSVRLPVNTLIFRADGLQVATVDAQNHVALKSVVMGRDFGNEVEIRSGITPQEAVIINPPDSLATGDAVRIRVPKEKKDGGKKSGSDKDGKAS